MQRWCTARVARQAFSGVGGHGNVGNAERVEGIDEGVHDCGQRPDIAGSHAP
jgi:hypothetical protein